MESLDAEYALLSKVRARHHDLQARLRTSLPLLWRDDALVLNSSASDAKGRRGIAIASTSTARSGDRKLTKGQAREPSEDALGNGMALEAQMHITRRYRRRVEWEVARRIARVDRELQKYPPAQRFWHQRQKKTPPVSQLTTRRYGGVGNPGASTGAGAFERDLDPARKKRSGAAGPRTPVSTTEVAKPQIDVQSKPSILRKQNHTRAEPNTTVKTPGCGQWVEKRTSPAKHVVEATPTGDKENRPPAPVTDERPADDSEDQPTALASPSSRLSDVKSGSFESGPEAEEEAVADDTTPPARESASGQSYDEATLPSSPPSKAGHSHQAPQLSVGEESRKGEDIDIFDASGLRDDTSTQGNESPRRTVGQSEERSSSSIGRQVLSEYRTMPSVASFGAQPVLSAGGPGRRGDRQLNADVLRRLFSDLDADHDGHVNRIETCMALHRLQISVPTSKIISFFHNIHSSTGSSAVRTRKAQYMPTKEVINYKEFVAFITAAYDQQQQRQQQKPRSSKPRMSSSARESTLRRHEPLPPLPPLSLPSLPSTSLPTSACPANTSDTKTPVVTATTLPAEQIIHRYELDDTNLEHEESTYESRVMKNIPDVLVSRILAEQEGSLAVSAKTREATTAIVRKSLESLVGNESIDSQIVNEIAQELIREHLHKRGDGSDEEGGDVTGLKQAAAYFEAMALPGEASGSFAADECEAESTENWIEVLTEEQVGTVVQQLWKEMRTLLPPVSGDQSGLAEIDVDPEQVNQEVVTLKDAETDTSELLRDVDETVVEKEVQTTTCDEDIQSNGNGIQFVEGDTHDLPPRNTAPRTHLGRTLGIPFDGFSSDSNEPATICTPVSTLQILQQLRQERRAHQIKATRKPMQPVVENPVQLSQQWYAPPSTASNEDKQSDTHLSPSEKLLSSSEMECHSTSSRGSVLDLVQQDSTSVEATFPLPTPTAEPLALVEKMLDIDGSSFKPSSSADQWSRNSFSTSSSNLSSTSDCRVRTMEGEIGRQHIRAAAARRRQHRRRRLSTAVSRSGSSVLDSICSAELSEGELPRKDAEELSDGEIFGKHKKKYVRHKNATISTMREEASNADDTQSSVESGELLALKAAHTSYRRHLLNASNSSSVESGELEDGMISPV